MRNTPVLLHDHNEYLNERTFLEGIKWYEGVIQALASVSREDETKAGVLLV